MGRVKSGDLKLIDATVMLELSYRQVKRLWRRYREAKGQGLKHGNAGRSSNRCKPLKLRRRVLHLIRKEYSGSEEERFGPTTRSTPFTRSAASRKGQAYNRDLVTEIQPVLSLRERLRRILLRTMFSVVAVAVLAFLADLGMFRIRVWMHRNPYGSVTVTHYYAVLQKNGKTQFIFDPPQPWTCVNALFPHSGSLPCWYLAKHPEQRTDI